MKLMNARGVRDFGPEEKIARQKVIDLLRKVFELYGFSPIETPSIERLDVLSAKYAGGAEILKETFSFNDQGGRELALRYDLTVPMCRFVGMNPNLKMPFKRYAIGRVFRDGPIKLGRYREFWQCDVDTVGVKGMTADAQFIQIAQKVFQDIGFEVELEVNNRKVLDGILESLGIDKEKQVDVLVAVDKIKKIKKQDVVKEILDAGVTEETVEKLFEIFDISGSNSEKIEKLKEYMTSEQGKEGLQEIKDVISLVDQSNVVFSLTLCRGLAYYTGTVFEGFLKNSDFKSSLCGGGRYDEMIGGLLESNREYPAVGISFGIEPITEMMKLRDKDKKTEKTITQLFIIPIKTLKESMKMAEKFREAGIKTDLDIMGRGISKNLDFANVMGIKYVAFLGGDEVAQNKVKIKNMGTGEENLLSIEEATDQIKNT